MARIQNGRRCEVINVKELFPVPGDRQMDAQFIAKIDLRLDSTVVALGFKHFQVYPHVVAVLRKKAALLAVSKKTKKTLKKGLPYHTVDNICRVDIGVLKVIPASFCSRESHLGWKKHEA
jgi:hypothetical protein